MAQQCLTIKVQKPISHPILKVLNLPLAIIFQTGIFLSPEALHMNRRQSRNANLKDLAALVQGNRVAIMALIYTSLTGILDTQ